ncbi:MAG: hypothetical protein ABIH41_01950 [Nanoarchaeota archaeon]
MKVKVIYAPEYREIEEKLNEFIKGKKIYDIKFQADYVDDDDHYSALVMYDD